jgi:hypothetical protein
MVRKERKAAAKRIADLKKDFDNVKIILCEQDDEIATLRQELTLSQQELRGYRIAFAQASSTLDKIHGLSRYIPDTKNPKPHPPKQPRKQKRYHVQAP